MEVNTRYASQLLLDYHIQKWDRCIRVFEWLVISQEPLMTRNKTHGHGWLGLLRIHILTLIVLVLFLFQTATSWTIQLQLLLCKYSEETQRYQNKGWTSSIIIKPLFRIKEILNNKSSFCNSAPRILMNGVVIIIDQKLIIKTHVCAVTSCKKYPKLLSIPHTPNSPTASNSSAMLPSLDLDAGSPSCPPPLFPSARRTLRNVLWLLV